MQHNTFKSAILTFTKAIKTVYFYSFYFTKFLLCPNIHIQKNTQFEDFMKISSIHQKLQQNEFVTFTVFPPSTNLEKTSEEVSFCWSCLIFIKQFGCCLSVIFYISADLLYFASALSEGNDTSPQKILLQAAEESPQDTGSTFTIGNFLFFKGASKEKSSVSLID